MNIKPYKSIFYVLIIFTIASTAFYYFSPDLINSNFYTALATFIVGLFAIYLYIRQKEDNKKDAANLIVAEIRQAERFIEQFKIGISNDISYQLLPNNNWGKHSHLFIGYLDEDEIAQINNFYNQCFTLNKAIDQINISHELKNKSQAIHSQLSVIAKESLGDPTVFKTNKDNFIGLINGDTYSFHPKASLDSIVKALGNINFITTSTAGAKLKKIAGIS